MALPWVARAPLVSSATPYTMGTAYTVQLNNAFQPGGGSLHSPYGWDQAVAYYRQYKVRKAVVKITTNPNSSTNDTDWVVLRVLPPGATSTMSGTLTSQLERPGQRTISQAAGATPQTIEFTVDFAELAGVTKQQFDNDISEYSAAVTAAPNRAFILQMASASAQVAHTVNAIVSVTYIVDFWQRIVQAQS